MTRSTERPMTRTTERLIDLAAMVFLLAFCYVVRTDQPILAGLVVGAAIKFWFDKNASDPDVAAIAAKAAAEVLATAAAAADKDKEAGGDS